MRWGETVGSSTGNRESFRFGIAAHFFVEGPRGDLTCMPEEVLKSRKAPGSSAVGKGWLGCFGPIFPASTVCLRCVQLRRNYPPRLGISPGRMSANTFAAGGAPHLLPLMVAGQAFPRWKRAAGVMMALDACRARARARATSSQLIPVEAPIRRCTSHPPCCQQACLHTALHREERGRGATGPPASSHTSHFDWIPGAVASSACH